MTTHYKTLYIQPEAIFILAAFLFLCRVFYILSQATVTTTTPHMTVVSSGSITAVTVTKGSHLCGARTSPQCHSSNLGPKGPPQVSFLF